MDLNEQFRQSSMGYAGEKVGKKELTVKSVVRSSMEGNIRNEKRSAKE